MRILPLVPLVTLVLSCATGNPYPTPRPADSHVKPVTQVQDYTTEARWRVSGYWRISDTPGQWPWFLVISGDGTACPSWNHELYIPRRGDYYRCSTEWRIFRR